MKKLLQLGVGTRFIASAGWGRVTRSVDCLQLFHTPVYCWVCSRLGRFVLVLLGGIFSLPPRATGSNDLDEKDWEH